MEPRFLRSHFLRSHMHINIHPLERWIRIILGAALVLMAFSGGAIHAWYLLGAIPLLTGLVGFCPFYYMLGWNTNRWARVKTDRSKR